ncbi:MAG: hypothetical protein EAX96_01180 [Candidatus Lokiarchaeota archaeon]|nr:hypothetical protein [Candidatus Lokiarchaeota archaeon]
MFEEHIIWKSTVHEGAQYNGKASLIFGFITIIWISTTTFLSIFPYFLSTLGWIIVFPGHIFGAIPIFITFLLLGLFLCFFFIFTRLTYLKIYEKGIEVRQPWKPFISQYLRYDEIDEIGEVETGRTAAYVAIGESYHRTVKHNPTGKLIIKLKDGRIYGISIAWVDNIYHAMKLIRKNYENLFNSKLKEYKVENIYENLIDSNLKKYELIDEQKNIEKYGGLGPLIFKTKPNSQYIEFIIVNIFTGLSFSAGLAVLIILIFRFTTAGEWFGILILGVVVFFSISILIFLSTLSFLKTNLILYENGFRIRKYWVAFKNIPYTFISLIGEIHYYSDDDTFTIHLKNDNKILLNSKAVTGLDIIRNYLIKKAPKQNNLKRLE